MEQSQDFLSKRGKDRIKKKKRQVELVHLGNWPEYQEFDYVYILYLSILIYICCCCSVTKSRVTLCNPMDCSTPNFPVLNYLPEFAKTHVH